MRSDFRDPRLFHALQLLKPLLLEACEVFENDRNPVTVTQLRLGTNKTGGFCFIIGKRKLRRGALTLESPRLKRKRLSEHDDAIIERLVKQTQKWVSEQEEETEDDQGDLITSEMLAEEEAAFLEEFSEV